MPVASMDLFIASATIIIIVIVAMGGLNFLAEPYIGGDISHRERYQQIVRSVLLSPGEPRGWGVGGVPTALGFSSGGRIYELDFDEVTRLNPSNFHALNYLQLWKALGVDDVSFRIRVTPLFNLTLKLESRVVDDENTTYRFSASTMRDGYPLAAQIRYYIIAVNFTDTGLGATNNEGSGSTEFTLPNSLNGTVLLLGMARMEPMIVTYYVMPFSQNSTPPHVLGAYVKMSPLNYTLEVDLISGATVVGAYAFTFNYMFKLNEADGTYSIPRLLDDSPIILVLTGTNGTSEWAEWTAYPQVPLTVGAEMTGSGSISGVTAVQYVVEIRGVLYRFEMELEGPT